MRTARTAKDPLERIGRATLLVLWIATMGAGYEWGGPAARGVRQLKEKRHAEAIGSLEEGRKDLPRSAAARYDQGVAAMALGLGDSARAAWSDAMALEGTRARAAAAYNLGNDALRLVLAVRLNS